MVDGENTPLDEARRGATLLGTTFISDAAAAAAPALVNIDTQMRWGGQGAGSGFIVAADAAGAFVCTNAHVVSEAARLVVTLNDGRQFEAAVHGVDPASDLAVLRITRNASKGTAADRDRTPFPTASIGSSSSLTPGEWVIALGSAMSLRNTVTAGIVSAVARHSTEIGLPSARGEYIQTDAAINQGNSGGPLVNLAGAVVGVNTMKVAGGDGIGFAIPMDTAWPVVQQLIKRRRVVRPYVGIRMITLTDAIVAQERKWAGQLPWRGSGSNKGKKQTDDDMAFPVGVTKGVLVVEATPGSPAQRAGLRAGDVLVAVDGAPVAAAKDVLDALGRVASAAANASEPVPDARSVSKVRLPGVAFTVRRGRAGKKVVLEVKPYDIASATPEQQQPQQRRGGGRWRRWP